MNLKIISTSEFEKDVKKLFKKYKLITQDLKKLREILLEEPKAGISLSNHTYKLRLPNSSTSSGKSGGFRVIYYFLDQNNNIHLLKIYSKTDLENLSEDKILEILKNNNLN
jgi:mRNA-degrading endonuclease RelE of RelBE toxin-antitoxin system